LHPLKKTVPEPFVPLMQGSSHWWRAALATTGFQPQRQAPGPSPAFTETGRTTAHFRAQREQEFMDSADFIFSIL